MLVASRRDPSRSLAEILLEIAAIDVHGRRWNSGTLAVNRDCIANQYLEYRFG